MKVYSEICWQMTVDGLELVSENAYEYQGDIALMKGEGTAQAQLDLQNSLVQQQLSQQKVISDQMRSSFSQYLNGNGVGFSPEQIDAANSQFLNQNTSSFNSAGSNVHAALAAQGEGTGALPVGGNYAGNIASLEGAKASSQSQGLLGLNIQNMSQALQNKFQSANIFQGQGAQFGQNVGTFNSGAGSALGNYVQAANAPGFLSSLSQGFGGTLGRGIGGIISGTNPGQIGGCWIAESLYGIDDFRTHLLRHWLNNVWAEESLIGKMVMKLYLKIGQRVAKNKKLCLMLKPLFDKALVRAMDWRKHCLESYA